MAVFQSPLLQPQNAAAARFPQFGFGPTRIHPLVVSHRSLGVIFECGPGFL